MISILLALIRIEVGFEELYGYTIIHTPTNFQLKFLNPDFNYLFSIIAIPYFDGDKDDIDTSEELNIIRENWRNTLFINIHLFISLHVCCEALDWRYCLHKNTKL